MSATLFTESPFGNTLKVGAPPIRRKDSGDDDRMYWKCRERTVPAAESSREMCVPTPLQRARSFNFQPRTVPHRFEECK